MALDELLRYGRGEFSQTNTLGGPITSLGEREQALLDEIRKYDPNATWRYLDNSGSSNEGGGSNPNSYVLDFDHSKLPRITDNTGTERGLVTSSGGLLGNGKPGQSLAFRGEVDPRWNDWFNLDDNKLQSKGVRWTDDVYGDMSFGARKKESFNWGSLAPMLVALAASAGTGGASLGLLGNLMYGLGPTLAETSANGGNLGRTLLNAGAGFIPGLAGLPPGIASQLASLGIRTAMNGGRIDPTNLAMILARNGLNSLGKP